MLPIDLTSDYIILHIYILIALLAEVTERNDKQHIEV